VGIEAVIGAILEKDWVFEHWITIVTPHLFHCDVYCGQLLNPLVTVKAPRDNSGLQSNLISRIGAAEYGVLVTGSACDFASYIHLFFSTS
jgi:hypothetical protein